MFMKKNFKIEGMHCGSCEMLVDMELGELEGVKSTNTSYPKGITEVEFDEEKVKSEDIIKAIEKTGYKVSN